MEGVVDHVNMTFGVIAIMVVAVLGTWIAHVVVLYLRLTSTNTLKFVSDAQKLLIVQHQA